MAYDPSIFNISPYYDDFSPEKGFLRVLFKPGYAVQARELTQLQTILQDQVSKVGDYLFKDGSRIVGGGISVRNSSFIMVQVGPGTPFEGLTDYSVLVGSTLTSTVPNDTTQGTVVHYVDPDVTRDGYLVLVVDFVSGQSFSNNVFDLTTTGGVLYSSAIVPADAFSTGNCKLVTVSDGIFYVNGFFVRTAVQHFAPYANQTTYRDFNFSNFTTLSKKIGFSTSTSDAVTEREDSTLRDPAIGSYNYNAPGADRYKIVLTLGQAELTETPDNFVELLRFESGKITKKIDRITYGEIQKALALRTYDESGSYTVRPFDLVVKQYDSANLSMSVGEGKAYVFGYEVENQHPYGVTFSKARQTEGVSAAFAYSLGNYIGVCMGNAANLGETFSTNLITIGQGSAAVTFRNSANAVVATGYVHGVVPTTPQAGLSGYVYRLYLTGITGSVSTGRTGYIYQHNTGNTLGVFVPTGTNTSFGAPIGTNNTSLVYEIKPGYAIADISSLRVVGKLMSNNDVAPTFSSTGTTYALTVNNFSNSVSSSTSGAYKFLSYPLTGTVVADNSNLSEFQFVLPNSAVFAPTNGSVSGSSDGSSVSLYVPAASVAPGFTAPTTIRVCAPIVYTPDITSTSTYRTKTAVTTGTDTFVSTAPLTDENGRKYFRLSNIDVYSVQSVAFTVGTVTTDCTEDFELDDGQREAHYENSRLYIKESAVGTNRYTSTGTAVSLNVSYSYFSHGGLLSAPFIGKHSYINFPYEQIPLYTNPRTGKTVSLANCLDFRRSGLTSSVPMLKPYGDYEFGIEGNTTVEYSHYLPRIDKLCVKSDPDDGSALFFFVQGEPDLSPSAPPDPADSLVLATVTVPAYTHNATDVVVTPVDSKRFTMADIGKINKRVDEVEVFAKLSLSEAEIEARSLRASSSATEPLKTSIFADEFYGHALSDVGDSTNSCSVDYERGELRPFFTTSNISLPSAVVSGTTVSSDGLLTLNYTLTPHIQNTQYTKTVAVNPSNTVNWLGFMKLSESVNPFYDNGYRPVVKTNALSENDNWISANIKNKRGFGTQWNEWESLWTGIEQVEEEQDDIQKKIVELPHVASSSSVPSFNSGSNRIGVSRKVDSIDQKNSNFISARRLKNRIRQEIGSRVVDRSVVPFIPVNTSVTATVDGLKPNATNLSVYFDGEVVKSGISTDANGSCTVSFGISAGTYLAGARTVRISDAADTANATIASEAVYYCTGLLEQRLSGSYSTRPPELRRQTAASETIAKDPFNRDIDSVESTHWSDPLSQTFFVDKKTHPDGIFLKSVELYFASKDSSLPVTVQIRPTVSGYPSPGVVLPFSTVTKKPSQVTANAVSPTATVFSFSSPVYLEPGEYSICVLANSDKYELFAADTGINTVQNAAATAGRAGNSQLVGTLFTAQGIGAAVENPSTDLMFTLNRCDFSTFSQGTVTYPSVSNCTGKQILKFYAPEIIPNSCSVRRVVGTTSFLNNQSVYLRTLFTTAPTVVYTLLRGASTAVSPVIDASALYGTGVAMYENSSTLGTSKSRYVSRVVDLTEQAASNGIAVFVDANIPAGSSVTAWVRYSINGEADIFSKPWVAMTQISAAFTSTSEIDFREAAFRFALASGSPLFKAYQVRVDMGSSSALPTYYSTPAVRNIRTVSFFQ